MLYLILKALHIIFMISYFAGIFYLVRIFVYYKDTDHFEQTKQKILREQYLFMMKRLWDIITVPAGSLMLLFGICLLILNPILLKTNWFHLKILFLFGLGGYHYWCWKKIKQFKNLKHQSIYIKNIRLRQTNEVATFILFLVVFTVILKESVFQYWKQLIGGFFVIVVCIMLTVKLVNKKK